MVTYRLIYWSNGTRFSSGFDSERGAEKAKARAMAAGATDAVIEVVKAAR